jgi:hypothetical protein
VPGLRDGWGAIARSRGTENSNSEIPGCAHHGKAAHKWFQVDVGRLDARGIAQFRTEAQDAGHKLAAQLKVGDWIAAEAREDAVDPYWIARAVDGGDGSPIIKQITARGETINGTHFTRGDFVIAVRFFHRDDADPQRLTHIEDPTHAGQVDVLNSTELRKVVQLHEVADLPAGPSFRSARRATMAARQTVARETKFAISETTDADIIASLSNA